MPALLVDTSVRVTILAVLVWAILGTARIRSNCLRHAAWTSVLAAMLGMPLLTPLVPSVNWPSSASPRAIVELASVRVRPTIVAHDLAAIDPTATAPGSPNRSEVEVVAAAPSSQPPGAASMIPIAITLVYGSVTGLLLLRFLYGWRSAANVARTATRTGLAVSRPIFQSTRVSTPVTIGLLFPRIVLPATWTGWPADTLAAVLAHENAHVRRRDPLIAFAAHLNGVIFWFHPVAWWLRHTLTITAEDACDEEAARVVDRRRYAECLIDLALAARARGGRLRHAVGVRGTGPIGRRVQRVLAGELPGVSRQRTVAVTAACAAAILLVAACRESPEPVTPLRENPVLAARIAIEKAAREEREAIAKMTADEVNRLEAALGRYPNDLQRRQTLKTFYQQSGQRVFGWNEMVRRRLPHILSAIEHHSEHALAWWPVSPTADPIGYSAAKAAWLEQVRPTSVSAALLLNAARFFDTDEPRITEQLLLRARERFPDREDWSYWLGYLYGHVMLGRIRPLDGAPLTPLDSDPFAKEVRERLLRSNEANVLTHAGQVLLRAYPDEARQQLGAQLLERALTIDSQLAASDRGRALRRLLVHDAEYEHYSKNQQALLQKQAELAGPDIARKIAKEQALTRDDRRRLASVELEVLASLPAAERLRELTRRAAGAYLAAEAIAHAGQDASSVNREWIRSKRAAIEALALAPSLPDSPEYGEALYTGNVVLALHALREGDRQMAVHYMREAGRAPASEPVEENGFGGVDQRLAHYLLKAGERESVADFYEAAARLKPSSRERLLRSAGAIRRGEMPENYQRLMMR